MEVLARTYFDQQLLGGVRGAWREGGGSAKGEARFWDYKEE